MKGRSLRIWQWLALALVFTCPARSLADQPAESDEARQLFEDGRALVKAGKIAAGCEKLERSSSLSPGVGVRFHLADCWEKLGRTASARVLFLGAAASAKAAGQGDREQVLRERAAALEPLLARLVINVETPSRGLVVQRDAVAVDRDSWDSALAVDPGKYVMSAKADGKKAWSETVEVSAGQTVTINVPELEGEPDRAPARVAASPAPKAVPKPAAARPPAPASDRGTNVAAVVAGGFGAGSLIVGGVMGLRYLKANGDAKDICPQSLGCSKQQIADHGKLIDEASTARGISFAATSIGAVGLVVAAVLYLRRPGVSEPVRSALVVDAAATPAGAFASLRGSF